MHVTAAGLVGCLFESQGWIWRGWVSRWYGWMDYTGPMADTVENRGVHLIT